MEKYSTRTKNITNKKTFPISSTDKEDVKSSIIRTYIQHYSFKYWHWYLIGLLLLALTTWVTVKVPELSKAIVNKILDSSDKNLISPQIYTLVALGFLIMLIRGLSRVFIFWPGRKSEADVKHDFFTRALHLPNGFFQKIPYGEIYYNNPSLILSRTFTKKSKWKLRYYNELEHEFNNRIEKASLHCNNYTKLFSNNITDIIFRFIIFICSSFFIILVILSLINDKILLNLLLTPNQSVLWFIGIMASLIAILRKKNNKLEKPEEHIKMICKYIDLDKSIVTNPNLVDSNKKLCSIFEYKYINLLKCNKL